MQPDSQTTLPPSEAQAFLAPLPLRAVTGVGHKLGQALAALGAHTIADVRPWTEAQLAACKGVGERAARLLVQAGRGLDPRPGVQPKGPPKSLSVEDSFKCVAALEGVRRVLRVLLPDLLRRVLQDARGHLECSGITRGGGGGGGSFLFVFS